MSDIKNIENNIDKNINNELELTIKNMTQCALDDNNKVTPLKINNNEMSFIFPDESLLIPITPPRKSQVKIPGAPRKPRNINNNVDNINENASTVLFPEINNNSIKHPREIDRYAPYSILNRKNSNSSNGANSSNFPNNLNNTSLDKKEGNMCLFEEHLFNNNTKMWEINNNELRKCLHSKCTRKHKDNNRPLVVCEHENDCPDAGITCFLLHDNTKIKSLCYYGKNCMDKDCTQYRHPKERITEICNDNNCENASITCFKLHTMSNLQPICRFGDECINFTCNKRHSKKRKNLCENGSMCYKYIINKQTGCNKLHPKMMQKLCRWDSSNSGCKTYNCQYIHNPQSAKDCENAQHCQDDHCPNKHPKNI
jgi:hypothetical protein